MCQDEKRLTILAAKDQVDRALWNLDGPNLFAAGIKNKDVSRRQVDISLAVLDDTFAPLLSKQLQVRKRAICADSSRVRFLLRLFADVERPSGNSLSPG